MISISLLWARKVTETFEKGARTRRPDGTFKIANGKVLLDVWRQRSRLESQSTAPPFDTLVNRLSRLVCLPPVGIFNLVPVVQRLDSAISTG